MAIQEVGSGDTRKKPIKLGGALVTLVEPHRGHEVEYNRWYERDHYYSGCMIGAWTIAGTRFVATSDCKAKRYPANSSFAPDTGKGSYLALYWILAGKFGCCFAQFLVNPIVRNFDGDRQLAIFAWFSGNSK